MEIAKFLKKLYLMLHWLENKTEWIYVHEKAWT